MCGILRRDLLTSAVSFVIEDASIMSSDFDKDLILILLLS